MKKLFIFIILFSFLFIAPSAYASSVSLSSLTSVKTGETFKVVVSANTDDISINSVDFEIVYPTDLVSFVGYSSTDTLVKMWVKSPYEDRGKVYMSGIIPGGVSGVYDSTKDTLSPIPVAVLLFKANSEGDANFYFDKSVLLQNDGLGTSLAHTQNPITLKINQKSGGEASRPSEYILTKEEMIDTTPPLPFVISFIKSALFSRTPDMIIFSTEDADSGILKYQMSINGGKWIDVESPTPVSKRLFSRDVVVRAYDYNDNFREAEVTVYGYLSLKMLFILLILLFSSILGYKLLK